MADRFGSNAGLLASVKTGSADLFFSLQLTVTGWPSYWLKPGTGSYYYVNSVQMAPRVKSFGVLKNSVSIRSRSLQAATCTVELFDDADETFKKHVGAGKRLSGAAAVIRLNNVTDTALGMKVFSGIVDSFELNGGVLRLELRSDDRWMQRDLLKTKATRSLYQNIDSTAVGAFLPIALGYCRGVTPLYINTTKFRYAVTIDRLTDGTTAKCASVVAVYLDGTKTATSNYALSTDRVGETTVLNIDFTSNRSANVVTCDVHGSYNIGTMLAEFYANGRITGSAVAAANALFASGSYASSMIPDLPRCGAPYGFSRYISGQTTPMSELNAFCESANVGIVWDLDGKLKFVEDYPTQAAAPLTTWLRDRVNFTPRSAAGRMSAREIIAGLSSSWDTEKSLDVADFAQTFAADGAGGGYDPSSET